MVSQTVPFAQLIAGFKSRPHVNPWLRPWGLYPQRGSYPYQLTVTVHVPVLDLGLVV